MERCTGQRNQRCPSVCLPSISVPAHLPCLSHLDVNVDWPLSASGWKRAGRADRKFQRAGKSRHDRPFFHSQRPRRPRVDEYVSTPLSFTKKFDAWKNRMFSFSQVRGLRSRAALLFWTICPPSYMSQKPARPNRSAGGYLPNMMEIDNTSLAALHVSTEEENSNTTALKKQGEGDHTNDRVICKQWCSPWQSCMIGRLS